MMHHLSARAVNSSFVLFLRFACCDSVISPKDIFGGDCSRIARIRTVLDEVVLSDMNCQDQRALNLAFNSANILCFEVGTFLSCLHRSVHAQRLVIPGRSTETYSNLCIDS